MVQSKYYQGLNRTSCSLRRYITPNGRNLEYMVVCITGTDSSNLRGGIRLVGREVSVNRSHMSFYLRTGGGGVGVGLHMCRLYLHKS